MQFREIIRSIDSNNMYGVLEGFPRQAKEGVEIGVHADVAPLDVPRIRNIVLAGMGGSAIGGDILRSYLAGECAVPIAVIRNYRLPSYVDPATLFIAASYSGDTEGTLTAPRDARDRGAQVLSITSGGILRRMSEDNGIPMILIPGGLAPRCALGYSFFPLLTVLERLGITRNKMEEMQAAIDALRIRTDAYRDADHPGNEALRIARALSGHVPVIYSAQDYLDVVGLRWRNQMQENAKRMAYSNCFPELNHNEIVGWQEYPDLLRKFFLILLRTSDEHPRVSRRIDFTARLIADYPAGIIECRAEEKSLLARIFGLICLGDWVSFYSAVLAHIDPFPIDKIRALKQELERGDGT